MHALQVFDVVERLAGDTEPSVRAELMEQVETLLLLVSPSVWSLCQVPHIAMFCQELSGSLLGGTVPTHLLPLVVKFLTDTNNQVSAAHRWVDVKVFKDRKIRIVCVSICIDLLSLR